MKIHLPLAVACAAVLGVAYAQEPSTPPPGTPPPNPTAGTAPDQANRPQLPPPAPHTPPPPAPPYHRPDRDEGRGPGRRGEREHAGAKKPFLGIVTTRLAPALSAQLGLPEGFGLLVQAVVPDSPAAAAGIQRFDVLKLLNDQQLVDGGQLQTLVHAAGAGADVSLTILRKGQEQKVTAKLTERSMSERPGLRGEFPRGGHQGDRDDDDDQDDVGPGREDRRGDLRNDLEERMRERRRQQMQGFRSEQQQRQEDREDFRGRRADRLEQRDRADRPRSLGGLGNSRLLLKDQDGELEVSVTDGKHILTTKDAQGNTTFQGPIDTEEQRRAIPADVRRKLQQLRLHGRAFRQPDGAGRPGEQSPSANAPGESQEADL